MAESAQVLALLNQPTSLKSQADAVVAVITAMAHDYTRGKGFQNGKPVGAVDQVIILASARLMANPEQLEYTSGSYTVRNAFDGWNALEQKLLDGVRGTAR